MKTVATKELKMAELLVIQMVGVMESLMAATMAVVMVDSMENLTVVPTVARKAGQ